MKRLLLIVAIICSASLMWAGQVSRSQALSRARQFLAQKGLSQNLSEAQTQMSKARQRGQQAPDYYYVFNVGENQGFVIISGDDRTPAVLGYADKGSFDVENMPDNMRGWLEGYAEQIKYVQQYNVTSVASRRASRKAVAPFITSHWDQRSPFSDACAFKLSGGTVDAVSGCVSTAMAQVMYYYKHPSQTTADIPAYSVKYNGLHTVTFDAVPAGTSIDWGNMIDRYTDGAGTDEQRAAVAKIVYLAGKSVETTYSNTSSSAKVSKVAEALKNYFGYGPATAYKQKWAYNADAWDELIYNEIQAQRPVIYGGQTQSGDGHAFVLDGCDADGLYHVNWGWGDLSQSPDGYFRLSAMNPPVEGTGGALGGYNDSQEAVVGIRVGGALNETVRLATTELTFNGKTASKTISRTASVKIAYQVTSHLVNTYDVQLQVGLFKDGALVKTIAPTTYDVPSFEPNGYLTSPISYDCFLPENLAVGKYQIMVVSRAKGQTTWLANERSDEFFITAIVNQNDVKLVFGATDEQPQAPEVTDEQRDGLKTALDALKKAFNGISSKVDDNSAALSAIQSDIQTAEAQQDKVDKQVVAIEKQLDNDLLSADEQKTFNASLTKARETIGQHATILAALDEQYNSVTTAHNKLVQALNAIAAIITDAAKAVETVDTKDAYNALSAKLSDAASNCDGIDIKSVVAGIKEMQDKHSSLPSLSTVASDLTQLAKDIDAAIAAAQKAKEEAEQKAKEEAERKAKEQKRDSIKQAVADSADALTAQIASSAAAMADAQKQIDVLKVELASVDELLAALADEAKALKDILDRKAAQAATRSEGFTDEQRQQYQAKLDDLLNTQIPALQEQREKVSQAIQLSEEALYVITAELNDLAAKTADVKAEAAKATTIEEAEAQSEALGKLKADAAEDFAAVTALADAVSTTAKASEALSEKVKTVVADAQSSVKEAGETWTAIGSLRVSEAEIIGRYDTSGRPVDKDYKGVVILRLADGKTVKIFNR